MFISDKPITADSISAHLRSGGVVQLTTYTRSTVYEKKHADWFTQEGDKVYVRAGRGKHLIINGTGVYVGIKFGRYANA